MEGHGPGCGHPACEAAADAVERLFYLAFHDKKLRKSLKKIAKEEKVSEQLALLDIMQLCSLSIAGAEQLIREAKAKMN